MSPARPTLQVIGRRLHPGDHRLRDFLTMTAAATGLLAFRVTIRFAILSRDIRVVRPINPGSSVIG